MATKGVEEMQAKLNAVVAEKNQAIERANSADQALAVERSLKGQLAEQLVAKDKTIQELREQVQSTERERKEAEELAVRAQMDNFRLGYDDAVFQAKRLDLDYKKLLLNPEVDTILATETEAEAEGEDETHGSDLKVVTFVMYELSLAWDHMYFKFDAVIYVF